MAGVAAFSSRGKFTSSNESFWKKISMQELLLGASPLASKQINSPSFWTLLLE